RKIKKLFEVKDGSIKSCMKALSLSGWSMDLEDKEIKVISKNKGIIRNTACRVQNTRIKKGLDEFACKPVRYGFLKSFAKEINPEIEVVCNICPPDEHPDDLWCEWIFKLNEE
ncbi:MAG: hypothetical protein KGY50_02640, partial [Candidatus Thermoplasmatota archaeon]|nr:hypothetical protein [Candidatus Thermoplasmatota archaeon]